MAVWEGTTSSDRRRAAEAWRDLAERCRSHGNRRQAALCYRRLVADFGDVRFDDGLRPADLIAMMKDDRPLSREIEEVGSDPWPAACPRRSPTRIRASVQFFHLPVEIVPGSLCERLDVALDHQGETLRFQGIGHSTYWDVGLPSDNPRFRGGFPLHRAWGVGPLVIAQVEPTCSGSRRLTRRAAGPRPFVAPRSVGHVFGLRFRPGGAIRPRRLALGGERILMTDRLGRPVARVGPVGPGYVCYQDRGSLVAIDPLSGKLLWPRPMSRPPI